MEWKVTVKGKIIERMNSNFPPSISPGEIYGMLPVPKYIINLRAYNPFTASYSFK